MLAGSLLRLASRGMSDRGPLLLFYPPIGATCSLAWVRCVVVETRITGVTSPLCGSEAATNVDPRRSPSAEGGKMRHFCWGRQRVEVVVDQDPLLSALADISPDCHHMRLLKRGVLVEGMGVGGKQGWGGTRSTP